MISDGLYTHASDVWAFGILAWELYTSFTAGQDRRDLSIPYYDLNDHEVNIKDTTFRTTFSTDTIVVTILNTYVTQKRGDKFKRKIYRIYLSMFYQNSKLLILHGPFFKRFFITVIVVPRFTSIHYVAVTERLYVKTKTFFAQFLDVSKARMQIRSRLNL